MASNSVTLNVHLDDAAGLSIRTFPDSVRPFVSLEVGPSVSLLASDVAVLDVLAVQVAKARNALVAIQAGHPSPVADPVAAAGVAV